MGGFDGPLSGGEMRYKQLRHAEQLQAYHGSNHIYDSVHRPTSWKWTWSTGLPCTLARLRQCFEDSPAFCLTEVDREELSMMSGYRPGGDEVALHPCPSPR